MPWPPPVWSTGGPTRRCPGRQSLAWRCPAWRCPDRGPSGPALSGPALSRLALSGLALSGLALSGLALSGLALSGLAEAGGFRWRRSCLYAVVMPDSAVAVPSARRPRVRLPRPSSGASVPSAWRVTWSVPAAMRALRATIVMPALFALTYKVIGDLQMATFAAFGSFATLVLASFGGSRRDKAVAHLQLALVGSAALIIGTLVSGNAWLAAVVTIPVTFAIFFGGVTGPNAASGTTAALLAYVLPVATPHGTIADIPSRLAGWWLASVAGTAAVLLLSPRSPGDRLRAAAAASANALASHLEAVKRGDATPADREAAIAAKHQLMNLFSTTPYRPTGLATADQGLANVAEMLEWVTSLITDALDGGAPAPKAAADRELLGVTARVLADVALLLSDQDVAVEDVARDIGRLEEARAASSVQQRALSGDPGSGEAAARRAVHTQTIAVAARSTVADALIAAGRADPETVAAQRRSWYGQGGSQDGHLAAGRLAGLAGAARLAARHADVRSVWFRSSARGAVALAVAVLIADLADVQHGFWIVLGTLSVLRTNAAATGATVLRALAGTVVGFAVGSALMLAIGTNPTTLWIVLPIVVLVASYTPGTAPFAVGQAAFTITVIILFNLLVPAGWKVGLVRVQDVVIGCAVSLVVGVLFWPRGAGAAVGDDLADAFRAGAAYLTQAVDWALGLRPAAPDTAVAAASAGIRLDDALRLYLAEQGTKRMDKHDLWLLVLGTTRVRLTAASLAGLCAYCPAIVPSAPDGHPDQVGRLRHLAADLADFYQRIAAQLGPPRRDEATPAAVPVPPGLDGLDAAGGADGVGRKDAIGSTDGIGGTDGIEGAGGIGGTDGIGETDGIGSTDDAGDGAAAGTAYQPHALWVREHLQDLGSHAPDITGPAEHVAQTRRVPWWR
jgi:uncharacterized membrane protein YccC